MYLAAAAGFLLLFGGGELLVRGAVAVSRRFGLSPLLIGMTVVAGCTSAPELVVSVDAALAGSSDIAVGNVIGSNIFNVLGVLGTAALIAPIVIAPAEVRRDTLVMLASSFGLAALALTGSLGRGVGLVFVLLLVAYITWSYRVEIKAPSSPSAELHEDESEQISAPASVWTGLGYLTVGLLGLVIGSRFLIDGATQIARTFGVSEAIIGLSLIALGTSLPELATSMMAALRGHSDVAVGNVVGSNIFNVLAILGVTALIKPISVSEHLASFDVWIMVAVAVALGVLLLGRGRIGRVAGGTFLVGYAAYMVVLFA